MHRYGFKMRLKDESVITQYEQLHLDIGGPVRAAHTRAGFHNYSIFRHGLDLFGYFETEDPAAAFERIALEPIMADWWARTNPLMETDGAKPLFIPMKQVFYMP